MAVNSVTPAQQDAIAGLYAAFWNRAPDTTGFGFWVNKLASGEATLDQIATEFRNAPEGVAEYPLWSTNVELVTEVYNNVFGRAPDPVGLAFWVGKLTAGAATFPELVVDMCEAALTNGSDDGKLFTNKVDVGVYVATVAQTDNGYVCDNAFNQVTADPASVATAEAWVDANNTGATYTLTTNIDTINVDGHAVNTVTGNIGSGQTYNSGDTVNGNNLTKVNLVVDGVASAARAPVVDLNNVASVNINLVSGNIAGATAATINETEFTNVPAVTVTSGVSGSELLVTGAAQTTVHGFAVTGRNFVQTIDYATTTGTADVAALSVAGTGVSATSRSTFNVADGDTIEAVTLATSGTNYVTVNAGTAATSIKATGSGTNTIVLGTAANSKLSVDLSGTTGTNTFDIGANLNGTTTVVGGTGADTLKVNLTSATQVNPTVSGVETLTLDVDAVATYNASKTTGVTNLNITGSAANATVTQLAATASTLGTTATNAGTVNVQYVTGAKTDVVYNIGSSEKTATAVSNGGTSFSNINSLTVNAAGSGTSGLGALNVGSAATALTLNTAAAANDLTVGALTGAALTSLTINATAGDVTLSTANDVTASKLQTITATSTGGADLDILGGQDFLTASALTTYSVEAGDNSTIILGGATAAKALQTISMVAGDTSSITSRGFVVHDTDSALSTVSVEIGNSATLSLEAAGTFIDGNTKTALSSVDIVAGGLAAASRIGAIEGNSIGAVNLTVGDSTVARTLTLDALKGDTVGDINVTVGQNSTITVTTLAELNAGGAPTGSVGNIIAAGKGAFNITSNTNGTTDWQSIGSVDFSNLEGGGSAVFSNQILTGATFTGGAGADLFVGTGGADGFTGGAGADSITSGAGQDTINLTETASGIDVLYYNTSGSNNVDVVTGLASGVDSIFYARTADAITNNGVANRIISSGDVAIGATAAGGLTGLTAAVDTNYNISAAAANAKDYIVFSNTAATSFATAIGTGVITHTALDNATDGVIAVFFDDLHDQAVFGYIQDGAAATTFTSADTFVEVARVGMVTADYTAANIDAILGTYAV